MLGLNQRIKVFDDGVGPRLSFLSVAGFLLFGHLNPKLGCQFRWSNSRGLLARCRAGNGPTRGVLGLHRNPGAFVSAVELHKFGEARAHLLNGALDLGFVNFAVVHD